MKNRVLIGLMLTILSIINPISSVISAPTSAGCPSLPSTAEENDNEMETLPAPVRQGLELYRAGNIDGAVDTWANSRIEFVKNNPDLFESSEAARQDIEVTEKERLEVKKILKRNVQLAGACQNYTLIQEFGDNTNRFVRRFIIKIQHEQSSFFMEFITLKTSRGEYIIHMHFSSDIREVLKKSEKPQ
jgi:hypothetical protein